MQEWDTSPSEQCCGAYNQAGNYNNQPLFYPKSRYIFFSVLYNLYLTANRKSIKWQFSQAHPGCRPPTCLQAITPSQKKPTIICLRHQHHQQRHRTLSWLLQLRVPSLIHVESVLLCRAAMPNEALVPSVHPLQVLHEAHKAELMKVPPEFDPDHQ
jgi:hypothetical protein